MVVVYTPPSGGWGGRGGRGGRGGERERRGGGERGGLEKGEGKRGKGGTRYLRLCGTDERTNERKKGRKPPPPSINELIGLHDSGTSYWIYFCEVMELTNEHIK